MGSESYYYIKDHLGSIRQTIDESGVIVAAQDYYAYGEIILGRSYNAGMVDEKYKFTEKERDNETNYDYFGARYYNSKIGLWNSVDPLADKYPGISPYTYCVGNPVRIIDPNGETIYVQDGENQYEYKNGMLYTMEGDLYTGHLYGDGWWDTFCSWFDGNNYKGYAGDVFAALREIEYGGLDGNYLVSYLVNSTKELSIKEFDSKHDEDSFVINNKVYWEDDFSVKGGNSSGVNSVKVSSYYALSHELGHAWDWFKHSWFDPTKIGTNSNGGNIPQAENIACGIENLIRKEHDLELRSYYEKDQGKVDDFSFEK